MATPSFVYTTYIATTPEKVWQALVDTKVAANYWRDPASPSPAHVNVSDWKPGSTWQHQRQDAAHTADIVGTVVEVSHPSRLVLTWARPEDAENAARHSRVTFDIKPHGDGMVCLTVSHEDLDQAMLKSISGGWPVILSNLKTFLESGHGLPSVEISA